MKYVRFETDGREFWGVLNGEMIRVLDGNFLDGGKETEHIIPLSAVRLLAPVKAPNIVCIGLNYKPHAKETEMKLPEIPLIFIKTNTALAGPKDDILLPRIAPDNVDYEGELTVVIGKRAKNVSEMDALDYVFGYTIANDISARDCQLHIDRQWARSKSFDTFCPIGPVVATGIDPDHLYIQTRLNGRVMQDSNTEHLIFSVRQLVSFISRNMTLLPGTIILTGTPEGVGFSRTPPVYLRDGDEVDIKIEGIGTLTNRVRPEP